MSTLLTIARRMRAHPKKSLILGLVFVVAVFGAIYVFMKQSGTDTVSEERPLREVTVATIAALSEENIPLALVGEVRAKSEAELRAEKGGQIVRVYTTPGARVAAGAILAEVEHQAESAAVLQAKGALDAALAGLEKARAGARAEDAGIASSQSTSAALSFTEAQSAAENAYRSAFSLAQDAILAKADTLFTSAQTVRPNFIPISPNLSESTTLENERVAIGDDLLRWQKETQSFSADTDITATLNLARTRLERIKKFLDQVGYFVSIQKTDGTVTATSIASQNAVVLGARSAIDNALAGITGASQALKTAENASRVAALSYEKTLAGDRPEDIRIFEASVTQARGAYLSALARLETALVRTPIAGEVAVLGARVGSYTTPGETLAVVTSASGIEVETFVSEATMKEFPKGTRALINGTIAGTITSVESGLDPVTKKARVHIAVGNTEMLTPGQFVEVALVRDTEKKDTASQGALGDTARADIQEFFVPLSALKVLPDGLFVFTVSSDNILVAHPISEGPLVGDKMRITSGVTPDMQIVTDVRGLNAGDIVSKKTSD